VEGSSRFGADNRYGTFPSGSFGWIISDEPLLENTDFLSFLKLRASYGLTGNAAISNFPALALAGSGQDYNNVPGIGPSQLANPNLKWETVRQLDVALDYAFFNNRVSGSLGYYDKTTEDLLLNRPIPATNGFNTFMQNIGEMKNSGIEFDISADIITGTFKWTSSFNIATTENEVTELVDADGDGEGDDIIEGPNIVREGEPLGAFYVVEYAGVNSENGDAQYVDSDGNIIPNSEFSLAHRKILGDPHPDYYGGFRNTFRYKGFELSALLQFNQGNEIYRTDGEFTDTNMNSLFNQSTRQLDYWTPDNTDASVPQPRFLTSNGSHSLNSRYLEDGSYIRLKSASIAYTLPQSWTPDFSVRVYASGQNLLTFTDFKGMDPEAVGSVNNNIQQGNLFFQPPQQRTLSFGVNLSF
jgi:TonB-linked SusC/RagA family outer membrane protein